MDDVPQDSAALRDWLRVLKADSELSFEEIGQAIGEESRNVKRWLRATGKPTLPTGDVILRLLSSLGVTFTPPLPNSLKSVNQAIDELRAQIDSDLQSLTAARTWGEALDEYARTGRDPLATLVATVTELAEERAAAIAEQDALRDERAPVEETQAPDPVAPNKTASDPRQP